MAIKKNWIESEEMLEFSEMLKSLAHPSRVSIVYLLTQNKEKKMTVKSIYEELRMSQPVISRHLGILKNSGLLQRVSEGINIYYKLNLGNKNVKQISACLSTIR
jgi:DNA-binding transcriptional ArsR family regulator